MKKIGLFTVAILLAALATGCSKSESDGDSNIKEKMENQQLINSIRQHIVGTWVHDGDCKGVYDLKTPANEIILKDELTFEEASEHDTFCFTADGKSRHERGIRDPYAPDTKIEYEGEWSVIGLHSMTDDYLWPPYGIRVDNHNNSTREYANVYFSADFNIMYLCSDTNNSCMMKYNRQ